MMRLTMILVCALSLGSCTATTRPCPAFGNPLSDEWSTALNVGDRVNFVSDRGATVSLELTEREDSKPYTGSSRGGSNVVICSTSSDRIYAFDNSELTLRVVLNQTRNDEAVSQDGESFTIRIRPEFPVGMSVINTYDYVFFLGLDARASYTEEFVLENDTDTGPQASRILRDVQIGSNLYAMVVEQKFADVTPFTDIGIDPASFKAITRMILAEGGGLVQFEMLNGEIFSRI